MARASGEQPTTCRGVVKRRFCAEPMRAPATLEYRTAPAAQRIARRIPGLECGLRSPESQRKNAAPSSAPRPTSRRLRRARPGRRRGGRRRRRPDAGADGARHGQCRPEAVVRARPRGRVRPARRLGNPQPAVSGAGRSLPRGARSRPGLRRGRAPVGGERRAPAAPGERGHPGDRAARGVVVGRLGARGRGGRRAAGRRGPGRLRPAPLVGLRRRDRAGGSRARRSRHRVRAGRRR